jgi:hypothetical protein
MANECPLGHEFPSRPHTADEFPPVADKVEEYPPGAHTAEDLSPGAHRMDEFLPVTQPKEEYSLRDPLQGPLQLRGPIPRGPNPGRVSQSGDNSTGVSSKGPQQ